MTEAEKKSITRKTESKVDHEKYYILKDQKLEAQAAKAETTLFKGLTFYILGYVGRGEESRYSISKQIERNGGRTCMMIDSHTTHVVAKNLCHSKRKQLDKAIEKRKILVVIPEYVEKCIEQQKLLEPTPFLSAKQNGTLITQYFS